VDLNELIDFDAEKRATAILLFGTRQTVNPLMFANELCRRCVEYANANGVQEFSLSLAKELNIQPNELMAMADNAFASDHQLVSVLRKIKDLWRRREHWRAAEEAKRQATDFSIPFVAQSGVLCANRLQEEAKREMDAWGTGIKFGYPEFDDTTGGLMQGQVFTILAGSGTYKTTMLMNMLIRGNKFNNKLKSFFFCFEMGEADAYLRMVSIATGLNINEATRLVRQGQDFSDLLQGIYTQTMPCDVNEMEQVVKEVESESGKVGLVVIDYLHFIKRNRVGDWVNSLMLDLKQMAKRLKVVLVLLAQTDKNINKTQSDGKRKRPNGFDASGGAGVMANSDFLWLQWRAERDSQTIGWFEKARTCHKKGGLELDYTFAMDGFVISDLVPKPAEDENN